VKKTLTDESLDHEGEDWRKKAAGREVDSMDSEAKCE